MICIEEPVPALLKRQDLAIPIAEFDKIEKQWLAEIGGPELYGLSHQEIRLLLGAGGSLSQHSVVLDVLQAIRKSLCSYARDGFAGLLDDFSRLTRTPVDTRPARQDVMAAFQRDAGGVLFRLNGEKWHLLLPTQQGVWGVCDGTRLLKREENPFL